MFDTTECSGPVVIGGVGGSGTRLIATFLRELGFYMGSDLNAANDNVWFTLLFVRPKWFAASSPSEVVNTLHLFKRLMMERPGLSPAEKRFILRAAADLLSSDYLHWGKDRGRWPIKRVAGIWPIKRVAIAIWLLRRLVALTRSPQLDAGVWTGWGWKEPNSHIYIEYISQSFRYAKYIHVIRHGLDMAYSSNQTQLHNWGSLFGIPLPTSSQLLPRASLDYWIRANAAAVALGKQLLGDRFLIINFDQLCVWPPGEVEKLLNFLDLSERSVDIGRLHRLCKAPSSLGRYKTRDLSVFDAESIAAVREFGFTVD